MTMSAVEGSSGVVQWLKRNGEGSLCQKEAVEFGTGKPAGAGAVLELLEARLDELPAMSTTMTTAAEEAMMREKELE